MKEKQEELLKFKKEAVKMPVSINTLKGIVKTIPNTQTVNLKSGPIFYEVCIKYKQFCLGAEIFELKVQRANVQKGSVCEF